MKPVEEHVSARGVVSNPEDLPFDSRGFSFQHYFPLDAEYVLRVNVGGGENGTAYELRLPVKAGLRSVAAAFLRESAKPEVASPAGRRGFVPGGAGGSNPPAEMDLRLDGAKHKRFQVPQRFGSPEISGMTILGPYNPTGRGDTASRARIFTCRPASAK